MNVGGRGGLEPMMVGGWGLDGSTDGVFCGVRRRIGALTMAPWCAAETRLPQSSPVAFN